MLVELVVEDYAVIERVRVRFDRGLNLLTGETGSGKSIVVDALALLFGERASADVVRSGAGKARISGIFEAPDEPGLRAILDAAGLSLEDGELLIEREILAEGKSRAFAASRPVTLGFLKDLAPYLGDIHGQHDQQHLFLPQTQLEMLDAFAGTAGATEEVARIYERWRNGGRELEEIERSEQERLRLADLWSFQRKEIEAVAPKTGEDAALEQERRLLQNMARLEEAASAAYAALYDSPESVMAGIRAAQRRLDELCRIDPALAGVKDSLPTAQITVEEASYALRDYLSRLEANPERLDAVETRLAALDRLKRKYGATIEEVLKFLGEVRAQMDAMETAEERREKLQRELKELAAAYETAAGGLSCCRKEAARKLEKHVEEELAALAMERTRFQIEIEAAPWSPGGADAVRYLVSPNVGEELRPLEKVASGGELSRIALALRTCVTRAAHPGRSSRRAVRTLVFDEVDAGIGGRAAETVGRRLKQLARSNQVLCVTHLPQIAGFADRHFRVEKNEQKGRTAATVRELASEERTREIGRMISGERLTAEALKHAAQLIRLGQQE
jgi:DNA repair protein RecN (Recombination protein N)